MIDSSLTSINGKFTNQLYDFVMVLFLVFFIAFANVRPAYVIIEVLFIGLFLIRAFTRNMRLEFYTYWSISYLVIGLVSVMFSSYISVSFQMLISIIQVLVVTNLLLPYVRENSKNRDRFQRGVILGIIVLGLRYIIATPFSSLMQLRAGSTIGYNANEFGFVFAYGTTIVTYLFFSTKKAYYFLLSVFFAILCMLSGSRTSLAVMVLSYALVFLGNYYIKGRILKFIKGFVLLSIIIGLLIILILQNEILYDLLGRRIVSFSESIRGLDTSESSTVTRLSMINDAFLLFINKPLFGYGLNTFRVYSGYGTYSHNNYTELLVTIGMIGTFVYYSFFIWILWKAIKYIRITLDLKYICVIAITLAALIGDLGTVSYYSETLYIIWLFCVSLIDRKDKTFTSIPKGLV